MQNQNRSTISFPWFSFTLWVLRFPNIGSSDPPDLVNWWGIFALYWWDSQFTLLSASLFSSGHFWDVGWRRTWSGTPSTRISYRISFWISSGPATATELNTSPSPAGGRGAKRLARSASSRQGGTGKFVRIQKSFANFCESPPFNLSDLESTVSNFLFPVVKGWERPFNPQVKVTDQPSKFYLCRCTHASDNNKQRPCQSPNPLKLFL
jgi:hypothetical protein